MKAQFNVGELGISTFITVSTESPKGITTYIFLFIVVTTHNMIHTATLII